MEQCPSLKEPARAGAISVEDMRAVEVNAVWLGLSLDLLMENAGRAVADTIECILGGLEGVSVAILAGKGGNGGDGIAAARHLAERGARVEVHLSHPPEMVTHGSTRRNLKVLQASGYARLVKPWSRGWGDTSGADVVVDALLGIGVKGSLREPILSLARSFISHQGLRVSIDTPTGVDPDTGYVAEGAVVADVTITLYKVKKGLLQGKAPMHTGRLLVAPIGIPPEAVELAGPGDVYARIPVRPKDAHKGVGGRVLVIGGSRDFIGAPILAALGAAAGGADLVYLASPGMIPYWAAQRSSTIIPVPLDGDYLNQGHVDQLLKHSERVHAVVVGPGLGGGDETLEAARILVSSLAAAGRVTVVDADALKAMEGLRDLGPHIILTPHRGEASRLLGGEAGDPRIAASSISRLTGATVLLKGPLDYICVGDSCRVNVTGVPSMSVGGTGDVLAGVVAGFAARRIALGRGHGMPHTSAAAAYIVGRAGELAASAGSENISAQDVIENIGRALAEARSLAES
ncbi:MAG: NAD(P)H-hydrate dehydratase [Desulfurococcales archaeon]|nr:NAD(P)H-hydrate dehydratase [Desulfurococcales archaeon]MCE4605538.1 NAD(P)H-hydrate dehydratase [Desulfurococcales archaeon]